MTICLKIKNSLFDIKNYKKYLKKNNLLDEKSIDFLNEISYNLIRIQKDAQKMENRLKLYHDTIEGLGFIRSK